MKVTTYRLTASNGRPIRMATRIILDDGKHFDFTEKLTKAEAIRQYEAATERQHRRIREQMEARHSVPTYHSDRLGAVTIPEDKR